MGTWADAATEAQCNSITERAMVQEASKDDEPLSQAEGSEWAAYFRCARVNRPGKCNTCLFVAPQNRRSLSQPKGITSPEGGGKHPVCGWLAFVFYRFTPAVFLDRYKY